MMSLATPPKSPEPDLVRILLADDHSALRSGLRFLIEGMPGFEVCGEASSGTEAVEMTGDLHPQIIIMDVSLPGINGIEATREIKREWPETEVLVFTATEGDELVHQVFEAGARGLVLKSAGMNELRGGLRALAVHKPYWTSDIAEVLLRKFQSHKHTADDLEVLTPRQRGVVQLLARGHSNKEVASLLGLSPKTVEIHRATCMKKLDLHSFSDMVRYAVRNGLIEA